jgi:hypothetical protein
LHTAVDGRPSPLKFATSGICRAITVRGLGVAALYLAVNLAAAASPAGLNLGSHAYRAGLGALDASRSNFRSRFQPKHAHRLRAYYAMARTLSSSGKPLNIGALVVVIFFRVRRNRHCLFRHLWRDFEVTVVSYFSE